MTEQQKTEVSEADGAAGIVRACLGDAQNPTSEQLANAIMAVVTMVDCQHDRLSVVEDLIGVDKVDENQDEPIPAF